MPLSGSSNNGHNASIKIFSVAAVIFLPPTSAGTVYGRNFDHIPGRHWVALYAFTLVLVVIFASQPYLWFKKKGAVGAVLLR